jgi:hypothetical protein
MEADDRYEAALSAALHILHRLDTTPLMTRPERLATATYAILLAIHRAEDQTKCSGGRALVLSDLRPEEVRVAMYRPPALGGNGRTAALLGNGRKALPGKP